MITTSSANYKKSQLVLQPGFSFTAFQMCDLSAFGVMDQSMHRMVEKLDILEERFRKHLAEDPEKRSAMQTIISKIWREVVTLDDKVSKIHERSLLLERRQEYLAASSIAGNSESQRVNGDAAGSLSVQGENRDHSDDETAQPKKKKHRKRKEELDASIALLVEANNSAPVQKIESPKAAKPTKESNKDSTDDEVLAFEGSDSEVFVSSKKKGKTPVKPSLSADKESESETDSYRTPTKKASKVINTESGNFIYIYYSGEDCR